MTIPQSDILTTNRLGKIFSNTVATYKFFWFVSIMHSCHPCHPQMLGQNHACYRSRLICESVTMVTNLQE